MTDRSRRVRVPIDEGASALKACRAKIELVPGGKRAYLWIGRERGEGRLCFGTASGPAQLRRLAKAILAEVGEDG